MFIEWSGVAQSVQGLGYGVDDRGIWFDSLKELIILSCQLIDRLWDPTSLLFNVYRGLFPGVKAAGAWSRPGTPNLIPNLTTRGANLYFFLPLHGVVFKHRDNFAFKFTSDFRFMKFFVSDVETRWSTGHTQKNGAVLIVNSIKTAPFFCVCPVFVFIERQLQKRHGLANELSVVIWW
jgi:hypothetical protein